MIKSSFFDSINGDRKYKADDWAAYFKNMALNGIFAAAWPDCLKIMPGDGMQVSVSPGEATINGYHCIVDAAYPLTLGYADAAKDRIDRIVLRLDLTARSIMPTVLAGTPADTPIPPDMTRQADVYDLTLADVTIVAGATAIVAANILDRRHQIDYCGVTTGATGVTPVLRGGTGATTVDDAQRHLMIHQHRVELCRFTTSGIFDPAQWPTVDGLYDVFLTGGGQSGRVVFSTSSYITQGTNGALCKFVKDLQITAPTTVIIGAGGIGSTTDYTAAAGGDTYFGDIMVKGASNDYYGNAYARGSFLDGRADGNTRVPDDMTCNDYVTRNPYNGIPYGCSSGASKVNGDTMGSSAGNNGGAIAVLAFSVDAGALVTKLVYLQYKQLDYATRPIITNETLHKLIDGAEGSSGGAVGINGFTTDITADMFGDKIYSGGNGGLGGGAGGSFVAYLSSAAYADANIKSHFRGGTGGDGLVIIYGRKIPGYRYPEVSGT